MKLRQDAIPNFIDNKSTTVQSKNDLAQKVETPAGEVIILYLITYKMHKTKKGYYWVSCSKRRS